MIRNLNTKHLMRFVLREINDYLFITFGLALYAISFTYFLLPYEIPSGGVTGISAIIFYATKIPMQYPYFIINVVLLLMAYKFLGIRFLIRTIFAIFGLSLMLTYTQYIAQNPDGTFPMILGADQQFMSIIIACIFNGIALAVVFLHNGSTGGLDIVAAAINKFKDVSFGQVFIVCDCCIVSSTLLIFDNNSIQKFVFGLIVVFLEAIVLDYVMNTSRESVQFFIFSKKYEDIAEAINTRVRRGVTLLDAQGYYSGKDMKVIVTIAKKRESLYIFRLIKMIDTNAFVSQSRVIGVFGEGFDQIKVSVPKHLKPQLVFATHNANKLEEVRDIMGDFVDILSLRDIGCTEDIPETADTLDGNSLLKAQYVYDKYHYNCFADDTGLEVDALNGAPGVHTARYAGHGHDSEANINKLLENLKGQNNRKAQFRTCITLINNGKVEQFDGIVRGDITTERIGEGGFGYDPIFAPEEYGKTFSELGIGVKNQISHRARAIIKLSEFLKKQLQEEISKTLDDKIKTNK